MPIVKSMIICLECKSINENEILINKCNAAPYIPLDIALIIKEKIDATIEFAKNHDIDALNDAYVNEYYEWVKQISAAKNKESKKEKTNIYVMIDKNTGYYKIGRSNNPTKREKTLHSEKPTIELLFHFEANYELEAKLHERFALQRIRGEWFKLTEEDISEIKSYSNTK